MNSFRLSSAVAVLVLTTVSHNAAAQTRPSDSPPTPARRTPDFSERYGLLSDKNIFVRNRPPTRRGSSERAPTRPEAMHVLTGITLQEGRHVAFIENTGTRSTQRLLPGESVAGGKVIGVTFDTLEFEINGQRVNVRVGRNLLGDVVAAQPPPGAPAATGSNGSATAPAAAAGDAGPAPAPLPGDPNMSAEERLRLRRQQQMGGSGSR